MTTMIIGVDLADAVFELAIANVQFEIQQRKRLSRLRFTLFCQELPPSLFLMEACNAAHHWARTLARLGHEVRLLPPQYVRPYVHRSKTDAADAAALLEASRCQSVRPVLIKTVEDRRTTVPAATASPTRAIQNNPQRTAQPAARRAA
jgi:transposase